MKGTRLSTIGLPLVDGVDRVDGVDAVDTSQAPWSTQSTQSTQSTRGAGHFAVAFVLLLALTTASACSLVVGNRMECDPDDDRCPPGSRCEDGHCVSAPGDGDADGDADADHDPEVDADVGPDGDADPDLDGDVEGDADGDAESDDDADRDADPDEEVVLCGDGRCEVFENACDCPEDCVASCGDGCCTHDESAATCPDDCPAECGDGAVTHDEDCEGDESRDCDTDCGTTGSQPCIECSWGTCLPPDEECNGLDDDCDDVPDNGFDCVMDEEHECTTTCGSTSTWTCGPTCEWPEVCEPGPVEICDNGEDDDCDGVTDWESFGDVRITDAAENSVYPSLVWTGTEYGVIWTDRRDGASDLYFTRISGGGIKIGPDIRITGAAGGRSLPSLVWTGTGYGVAWHDDRDGNNEIYFNRLGWCVDE